MAPCRAQRRARDDPDQLLLELKPFNFISGRFRPKVQVEPGRRHRVSRRESSSKDFRGWMFRSPGCRSAHFRGRFMSSHHFPTYTSVLNLYSGRVFDQNAGLDLVSSRHFNGLLDLRGSESQQLELPRVPVFSPTSFRWPFGCGKAFDPCSPPPRVLGLASSTRQQLMTLGLDSSAWMPSPLRAPAPQLSLAPGCQKDRPWVLQNQTKPTILTKC